MNERDRFLMEQRFSLMTSPRRVMQTLAPVMRAENEKLPEPLRRAAEAMYDAKTDDEARAAAGEFLLLSKEWSD